MLPRFLTPSQFYSHFFFHNIAGLMLRQLPFFRLRKTPDKGQTLHELEGKKTKEELFDAFHSVFRMNFFHKTSKWIQFNCFVESSTFGESIFFFIVKLWLETGKLSKLRKIAKWLKKAVEHSDICEGTFKVDMSCCLERLLLFHLSRWFYAPFFFDDFY